MAANWHAPLTPALIKMPFECVKKSTWISFAEPRPLLKSVPQPTALMPQTTRLSQSHKICGKLKSRNKAEKERMREREMKMLRN